ncbi:MAG: porin family protein [Bacteroidota bacterium]|nr:porin family protein [Bacteroidota bacterium]MDP4237803.1 porin family protein [Bacteroidota bacterium]
MKKNTIILLQSLMFVSLLTVRLSAQSSPSIWIGAIGGADIGKLTFDPVPSPSTNVVLGTRTGVLLGAELDDWFSSNFGVGAHVEYVQKGGSETSSFTFENQTFSFSEDYIFSYLQIPILFKATIGSGSFKPLFFVGPELGFKLSAKLKVTQNGQDTTLDAPDSAITSTNVGLLLGAGLTIAIDPTTTVFLTAGYDYGFTNLNFQYNPGSQDGGNVKVYTRDIRITAGILFGVGKPRE